MALFGFTIQKQSKIIEMERELKEIREILIIMRTDIQILKGRFNGN